MARRFAKVSEEEIAPINEAAFFYPSDLTWLRVSVYISTTIHLPFEG